MKQTRFKFRYVNEITGAFLLTVLLLIIGGVLMSERSQHWFSQKFAFDLLLPATGTFGLAQGNRVYILGIDAGLVDDIHVGEDGQMKAHVRIRSDFERFVRQDSVASIKKTFGVAGDSFVEITQGTGAPLPEQKPVILCLSSDELPSMMENLLDEVRKQIVPVMQKSGQTLDAWTSLATNINQTQGELRQVIARLNNLAGDVEAGKGTAGRLLTSDALANDIQQLTADTRRLITTGHASLEHFQAAMNNLHQGTSRLPQIGEAVAAEAEDLAGLVSQTQTTLHELERLVEGLQQHWLVRKYMEPPSAPGARIPPSLLQGDKP